MNRQRSKGGRRGYLAATVLCVSFALALGIAEPDSRAWWVYAGSAALFLYTFACSWISRLGEQGPLREVGIACFVSPWFALIVAFLCLPVPYVVHGLAGGNAMQAFHDFVSRTVLVPPLLAYCFLCLGLGFVGAWIWRRRDLARRSAPGDEV